jgi:hypothetical protein
VWRGGLETDSSFLRDLASSVSTGDPSLPSAGGASQGSSAAAIAADAGSEVGGSLFTQLTGAASRGADRVEQRGAHALLLEDVQRGGRRAAR